MKIWHQYPFIRLIIPMMIGILMAIQLDRPIPDLIFVLLFILLAYTILVLFFSKGLGYKHRWITGILLNLFLFIMGYYYTGLNTPRNLESNISHFSADHNEYVVDVSEQVSEKPNSYKVVTRVVACKDSLKWKTISGKLILYFQKDSLVKNISYGNRLIIQSNLQEVSPPMNPEEFNYKRYLSNKGIYSQGYIKSYQWQVLSENNGNVLKRIGMKLRSLFLEILQKQKIKGDEFAVVSAILLGYDDFLDSEQRKEFAGAGAMHILCVSGLHVGIIYFILNSLLLFLNKKKSTRILKVIILLLLIWLYALITGFSPSVQRAATMFSFVIIGGLYRRKVNVYNSLAASAFLLLLINPFIITEVGFQLSYLAVFGIVWLYKPIYNLFAPGNWLVRKVWQISVVSISATLATFPLSLLYFHQFPNLFLVTNFIAIPAATLIIYAGILVLLTSPVPIISSLFSFILVKTIWLLNYLVGFIEGLSFSTFRGVYIESFEAILIYLLIVSIAFFFVYKKKKYSFYSLGLIWFLFLSFSYRSYQNVNQNKICIYNIRNSTAIDFIKSGKGVLLMDSTLIVNQDKIQYHVANSRIESGIGVNENYLPIENDILDDHLYKKGNFVQFGNKRLLIINDNFKLYTSNIKIQVDFILLTKNTRINITDILNCFEFEELIIDNSNLYWNINRWIEECEKLGTNYHLVGKQGAREIII